MSKLEQLMKQQQELAAAIEAEKAKKRAVRKSVTGAKRGRPAGK